jgi:hypothetical protein
MRESGDPYRVMSRFDSVAEILCNNECR